MSASIVIPAYNLAEKTARCLDALARTARGSEVIVVDNGSADETARMLARRAAKERAFELRPVYLNANQNFAGGSNAGLAEATRDVVVFLNNDTIPEPGWLPPLVEALDDETIGAVGALLWYPGKPRRAQHAGMAFTGEGRAIHLYRGMTAKDAPGIFAAKDLQCVTGACLAMRLADARALDGFDPAYRNGWEDVDLCFRVRYKIGARVRYEPRSQLVHEEGQTPGRFANDTENARRFFERYGAKVVHDAGDIIARIDGGVRF